MLYSLVSFCLHFHTSPIVKLFRAMASNDSRQQSRRRKERRVKERRAVDYRFGSQEWLERVKQENYLWPKQDRRCNDRRRQDRRKNNRRINNGRRTSAVTIIKTHNLLTDEEKQMLNELMRQGNGK